MIEEQVRIVRDHIIDLGKKGHFESIEITGSFTRGLDPPEVVGNFTASWTQVWFTVRSGYERSEELQRLIDRMHEHQPFDFAGMRLMSTDLLVDYGSRRNDWSFRFEVVNWVGDGETD